MTLTQRPVQEVSVKAGGAHRDYPVLIGQGLLERLGTLVGDRVAAHRWVVIADENVAALYGDAALDGLARAGRAARLLTFPAGERHKTRETWVRLTDTMLEEGCGRDSVVIALGGGVTGDMAGFVAATFLRGVPVIQVPTSLVAMIDSAVGGKTGVDTPLGKNLVGSFHPPALVVVDPSVTRTLPRAERAQGLVEALKHGVIVDADYFERLARDLPALLDGDVGATERAVVRSVEIKAAVVSDDEREGGYRQILNFGHTIGHALESASTYALSHGEAVAAGMIAEARLGEQIGVTEAGTATRIASALEGLGLPDPRLPELRGHVLGFLGADKKRREGNVRCVLLDRVGRVHARDGWSQVVSSADVLAALD